MNLAEPTAPDHPLIPPAPSDVRDVGLPRETLGDLALRAASTVPQFNTEWMARRLHLPQALVGELLEEQRGAHLLEVLGSTGPFGFRYAISARGRERAGRLLEVSGYVGPAPVSLEDYTSFLERQLDQAARVTPEHVAAALADLVLPAEDARLAGLAAASGRSLFVHGPPGNGKTTLGRCLHAALQGTLWIPHALDLDGNVIRVFDAQVHQEVELDTDQPWALDRRWVRVRRPLIVGGGEMTLESFELLYSPALKFYEAPPHLKANGGTFLIDDFGRQRVEPHKLLNRWIIPLENRVDYLSLQTGQKLQVPFRMLLIIATNLDLPAVTDPAFLRRMGYRLGLDGPDPDRYRAIFHAYAARQGVPIPPGLLDRLLERYQAEGRELRACEPRDLVERVRDLCLYLERPLALDDHLLGLAWNGYFGTHA